MVGDQVKWSWNEEQNRHGGAEGPLLSLLLHLLDASEPARDHLPPPRFPRPAGVSALAPLPSPVAGVSLEGISALCTSYSLTRSHLDVLRARTVLYSPVVPALTQGVAHRGALQFTRSFHRESLAQLPAVNWKHGLAWWEQTRKQTGHGGRAGDHGSPARVPVQNGEWERGREGFPEEAAWSVTGEAVQ